MSEYNKELAEERHDQVMAGIAGIHIRLDSLNGRTRLNEQDIAVLKERNPGKQGGIWGSIGGFISGIAAGFMR